MRRCRHRFHGGPDSGPHAGSIALIANVDGLRLAFAGDLIYAPGKVWSMSATQWTYDEGEGIRSSVLSLLDLKEREPDLLRNPDRYDLPCLWYDPIPVDRVLPR